MSEIEQNEVLLGINGNGSSKYPSEALFSEQIVSECEKSLVGEKFSHLTLSQYRSMSDVQRSKINNRVR